MELTVNVPDSSKGNQHPKYGWKVKSSRHGNGHHRSRARNMAKTSRIGLCDSWHHVWYFSEEHGRILDYDIFPPKSYWKKVANRAVRYSREHFNHNGYRRIFDLWGLV